MDWIGLEAESLHSKQDAYLPWLVGWSWLAEEEGYSS
jgi:hypothetical protein